MPHNLNYSGKALAWPGPAAFGAFRQNICRIAFKNIAFYADFTLPQ
jgi:hypothetical protein